SFIFVDVGGTNDWQVQNATGGFIANAFIESGGDGDGPELGCVGTCCPEGDQLFIYQLPTPTAARQSSFVSMIQMDTNYSAPLNSNSVSEIPHSLSIALIVRFNTEVYNADYNCSYVQCESGAHQAAISNENGYGQLLPDNAHRWTESNTMVVLNPA